METFIYLCINYKRMENEFTVDFLEDVDEFFDQISFRAKRKILYDIDKAKKLKDPKLFKKLNDTIWEFRTLFEGQHYRLLAFWDKGATKLIICTHGFVKKTAKVPKKEIAKAENLRNQYFKQ